ncbi:ATP synthase F1 subcomplex delta subunit [Corynebacterium pollutisoli]|uniref:ATP synthase subunit delta n=1 Tax=Corynebacterium pollutisoli TaxID=1610489 RepID=A0A1X7JKW2_9CORY|nr:F0F1 ATP synthase subunit delta [Corynebacterium pollutisoli]NLP39624.1 F0F1 ATP synthase subunit delta [Corynebacterium pollutisoli]SMG28441.1 ATP synthase F1 subcomplex delta subunit [Corynebacterium pollutisoli]HJD78659.1 F0F1 ATP synthase subunit delta [Corynebacterium pollutisoli]
MHAASREALATVESHLDGLVHGAGDAVATAAQTGTELFDVVDALDRDRTLRVAVADPASTAERRTGVIRTIFGGKVSDSTLSVLNEAAAQQWSTPRQFRTGLVELGRRALLRGAEKQGQLGQVEDELFRLSRVLDREGELTQLLSDKAADPARKRGLLASVLYGKVNMITEALALQVIGRPEKNPIDDIANLVGTAAQLQGRSVAHVVSAEQLNEGQQAALADKLGRIYGRAMSIHSEVDPSLLGGMTIRVDDEIIDGSLAGKLAKLRANLA